MPESIAPRVYWRSNQYQYKSRDSERKRGLKAWEKLGTDPERALVKLFEITSPDRNDDRPFAKLFDNLLQCQDYAPRSITDKKQHFKQLTKVFGHMNPEMITPTMVQHYVQLRANTSKDQAKQELSTLSMMFRWGRRMGLVRPDFPLPTSDIQAPRLRPRDRYVTDEELVAFYELNKDFGRAPKGWCANMALLGYALGQRIGDLRAMRYSAGELHFTTSKTKRKAVIELFDWVDEIIRRLNPKVKDGGYILVNAQGKQVSKTTFDQRWQAAMNRYVEHGGERFHFHDLKAKFITDSEKAGIDGQKQGLHDNRKTTEIYIRNRGSTEVVAMRPPV